MMKTEDAALIDKKKVIQEGKLNIEQLKNLIFRYTDQYAANRPEVLSSPYIGEDCAVIDSKGQLMSVSSDPITAAVANIGRLAVVVNLNDIASSGADPLGIMVTMLCPIGTTEEEVAHIMEEMAQTAAEDQVQILGGHTEVTAAVNRMVLSVTALGLRAPDEEMCRASSDAIYDIYVTKDAGLEGVYIIASDRQEELSEVLNDSEREQIRRYEKALSVVRDAKIARQYHPRIMHDVTEGGLLGALWEVCELLSMGAIIDHDAISIPAFTKKIAAHYQIDPLRLISSGCLLFLLEQEHREAVTQAFAKEGITLSRIGVTTKERAVRMRQGEALLIVDPPESDELYKIG